MLLISIELAQRILTQLTAVHAQFHCFDQTSFANFDVLELGSGTGGLACLLAPYARSWTATDQEEMLPLINKNVYRNIDRLSKANLYVAELDWTWTDKQHERVFEKPTKPYDIVFAVDCLFNESLVQPLVAVLSRVPARVAVIACELRSEDVLRLFLEALLAVDGMQVERACFSVGPSVEETPLLGPSYVVWLAWRSDPKSVASVSSGEGDRS